MKTKILFTIIAFSTFCNAQIVNIPNAIFKLKLRTASSSYPYQIAKNLSGSYFKIDENNDGEIQQNEALQVKELNVSASSISSLEGIQYFTNLTYLQCNNNQLTNLNVSSNTALTKLQCEYNQLTNLNVSNNTVLTELHCNNNQVTNLNVSSNTALIYLWCYDNQLTNLNLSNNNTFTYLDCNSNQLTSLNVSGVTALRTLWCNNNQLTNLNVSNNTSLDNFECANNQLTNLNVSNNTALVALNCGSNQLTNLFIKNNKIETYLDFSNNPNLSYICADEGQLAAVQTKINEYGYATTCHVNTYCSFTPGGTFYTIQGNNKFDSNNNGCDSNDPFLPNLKYDITNGTVNGIFISNTSENYTIPVGSGSHTINPVLENPTYFNVSPSNVQVSFPATVSPFNQNFCITPNGIHQDVEVTLIPITPARPGFNATYKIIYKNKGNQVENGTVTFGFENQDALDVVSTLPVYNNESNNGYERTLTWNYSNLQPFESREINVILNLNSPTETPALNAGNSLTMKAVVTPLLIDEYIDDNEIGIRQLVVNSYDPNDKTCLEGTTITPNMVGEYVHYVIRFENTGTFPAENIVVKDIIDTTKFDINTLIPIKGSHNFETRISNTNKVEFIFKNINLPFDDPNNDGYVAFKIKTKPNLVVGNTFSNQANIYFDYNFPIVTNNYTTTVQNTLGLQQNEIIIDVFVYPNPVKDILYFNSKETIINIEIYDISGRIISSNSVSENKIDVSKLKIGNYILKLYTEKGIMNTKIMKE
ncbi:DUF7619 domain-containing protein [Flavobacterium facile]|uniref:DUF7619 domain-containing protein n=1 Tax=Flavobacterium facile TaxID=2893174 RepID=UPI002E780AD3|nr:T9SS type A sorting domain-containing protein [Flavobacterium sp. T-12]